ncbi:hypothetical protein [Sulfitobacter sp.]|uniref:hypothetical protein n=1 Tax=Sulfitobacter sp. TaxID=1903071 RepID=UPI003EF88E4C
MKRLALALAMILPAGAQAQEGGTAAWERIFAVASHPRCTNCHVGESGRPAWDDLGYAKDRVHGMNIVAGESRIGAESIPCRVCHISAEGANDVPHAAPQIDDAWRLPPVELAWRGKSSIEVCQQLRDPEMNDGFDMSELVDHVLTSAFVNYGFKPGAGRIPAPGSSEELAQDLQVWAAAGTPCLGD